MVIEDGAPIFDMQSARYSVSSQHRKCLLQLWSAERNIVRRVLDCELKDRILRLTVQRLGFSAPSRLDICGRQYVPPPSTRKGARSAYERRLRGVLERQFAGFRVAQLCTAMDLGRSFGPVYTRGLLTRGSSSWAVLGVNALETQACVDASVTFAVLWLDTCRQARNSRSLVEGLLLFVPRGSSALTRERIAHLDPAAAHWRLFEFDEADNSVCELDCRDRGNILTRLVRCPDERAAHDRFQESIRRVRTICPDCTVAVISPAEIAFRFRGLEFARARLAHDPRTFSTVEEIVFGVGAEETVLTSETAPRLAGLLQRAAAIRHPQGLRHHPLWRLHPERWLESLVLDNVRAIDERLDPAFVYSQVPAFSASDRAMLDVLTVTRSNRLAVLELKADEDIHLPLQGFDYWSRVDWHHQRREFEKFAYFPGVQLSGEKPVLLLVAPALHIHPATDILLRYCSPAVDCTLVGLDEHWREGLRVVFRKRPRAPAAWLARETEAANDADGEYSEAALEDALSATRE